MRRVMAAALVAAVLVAGGLAPTTFPTTTSSSSPNWLTQFVSTAIAPDSASGGSCHYMSLPGSPSCAVSWPNPTGL